MDKKTGFYVYAIGAVAVLLCMVYLVIFHKMAPGLMEYCPWVFAVAVAMDVIGKIVTLPKTDDFRIRRLNNLLAISSVLLLAASYFLFKGKVGYVVVLVLLSAFIDLWYTIRTDHYAKK